MDTEDETYLDENCALELTYPEGSDRIPLNPTTEKGHLTINAIKELNITSEADFNQTSTIFVSFISFCKDSGLQGTLEKTLNLLRYQKQPTIWA